MSFTGTGWWLNPRNDKFIKVERHELSAKDKDDQKALGLNKAQITALDLIKGDEDKVRMKAVNLGLVRVRDYAGAVHVQFSASRGSVRGILDTLLPFLKKTGLKKAWNIQIQNMNPSAKDLVFLRMGDFIKAVNKGDTVMKESKK